MSASLPTSLGGNFLDIKGGYQSLASYSGGAITGGAVKSRRSQYKNGFRGNVSDLQNYVNSVYSQEKEALIRNIAEQIFKALKLAKPTYAQTAPIEDVIKHLQKITPNVRRGKGGFNDSVATSSEKQLGILMRLGEAINEKYKTNIIPLDAPPKLISNKIAEVMNTLFYGLHNEFLSVAADTQRIIGNLNQLKEFANAAYKKQKELVAKTGDSTLMDTAADVDALYNAVNSEIERQMGLLANSMSVTIKPTSASIVTMLEENPDFLGLVNDLKGELGDVEFSHKLGYLLAGVSSVARSADKVNKALKTLGMSMSDYKNTRNLSDLHYKVYSSIANKKANSKDMEKLLAAAESIYKNDIYRDDIIEYLEKKVRGGYVGGYVGGGTVEELEGKYKEMLQMVREGKKSKNDVFDTLDNEYKKIIAKDATLADDEKETKGAVRDKNEHEDPETLDLDELENFLNPEKAPKVTEEPKGSKGSKGSEDHSGTDSDTGTGPDSDTSDEDGKHDDDTPLLHNTHNYEQKKANYTAEMIHEYNQKINELKSLDETKKQDEIKSILEFLYNEVKMYGETSDSELNEQHLSKYVNTKRELLILYYLSTPINAFNTKNVTILDDEKVKEDVQNKIEWIKSESKKIKENKIDQEDQYDKITFGLNTDEKKIDLHIPGLKPGCFSKLFDLLNMEITIVDPNLKKYYEHFLRQENQKEKVTALLFLITADSTEILDGVTFHLRHLFRSHPLYTYIAGLEDDNFCAFTLFMHQKFRTLANIKTFDDICKELEIKKLGGYRGGGDFDEYLTDSINQDKYTTDNKFRTKRGLSYRIQTKKKYAELALSDFKRILLKDYKKVIAATDSIADQIGKEIPANTELYNFIRHFEQIPKLDDENMHKSLASYARDVASREKRFSFMNVFNAILESLGPLKKYSPDFKSLESAIVSLMYNIDNFADSFLRSITELQVSRPDEVRKQLNVVLGGASTSSTFVDFNKTLAKINHKYQISRITENTKHWSGENYSEGYSEVLGEESGWMINQNNLLFEKLTASLDDNKSQIYQVLQDGLDRYVTYKNANPNIGLGGVHQTNVAEEIRKKIKENMKKFFLLQKNAKNNIIKVVQAVDLYLKYFTEGITKNPESIKDMFSVLSEVDMVAKWFNNRTGDNLAALFEFFPHQYDYNLQEMHLYGGAHGSIDTNGKISLPTTTQGAHYYDHINMTDDANKKLPGNPYTPVLFDYDWSRFLSLFQLTNKTVKTASALENILNVFKKVGSKFGGMDINHKNFMDTGRMFKLICEYITMSSYTNGLLLANSEDQKLTDADRTLETVRGDNTYDLNEQINLVRPAELGPVHNMPNDYGFNAIQNDNNHRFALASNLSFRSSMEQQKAKYMLGVARGDGVARNTDARYAPRRNDNNAAGTATRNVNINNQNNSGFKSGLNITLNISGLHWTADGKVNTTNIPGGNVANDPTNRMNNDPLYRTYGQMAKFFGLVMSSIPNLGLNKDLSYAANQNDYDKYSAENSIGVEFDYHKTIYDNNKMEHGIINRWDIMGFQNRFYDTDLLFQMMIKSIVAKVLTTVDLYRLFNRPLKTSYAPSKLYVTAPVRSIIGGAVNPESLKLVVSEDTFNLFARLTLLGEWYRDTFAFRSLLDQTPPNANNENDFKMSMYPGMDNIWGDFNRFIFQKTYYVKDGNYTEQQSRELIEIILAIYKSYKEKHPKYTWRDVISCYVVEMNRLYGYMKLKDIDEYVKDQDDVLRTTQYDNPVPDDVDFYDILDAENSSASGIAPSDKYVTQKISAPKARNTQKLELLQKSLVELRNKIDSQLRTSISAPPSANGRFVISHKIANCLKDCRAIKNPTDIYNMVLKLIQGIERTATHSADKLIALHEMVAAPLNALYSVYCLLLNFVSYMNAMRHGNFINFTVCARDNYYRTARILRAKNFIKNCSSTDLDFYCLAIANKIHASHHTSTNKKYFDIMPNPYDPQLNGGIQRGGFDAHHGNTADLLLVLNHNFYFDCISMLLDMTSLPNSLVTMNIVDNKININFSKLVEITMRLFELTKSNIMKLTPMFEDLAVMNKYIKKDHIGSLTWLEENLIERLIRDRDGFGINKSATYANLIMDRVDFRITEKLLAEVVYTQHVTTDGTNTQNRDSTLLFGQSLPGIGKYPRWNDLATFPFNVTQLAPILDYKAGKEFDALNNLRQGKTSDAKLINSICTVPGVVNGLYDTDEWRFHDNWDGGASYTQHSKRTSLMMAFNNILAHFIESNFDNNTQKIYLPLIENFANITAAREFSGNNTFPDIVSMLADDPYYPLHLVGADINKPIALGVPTNKPLAYPNPGIVMLSSLANALKGALITVDQKTRRKKFGYESVAEIPEYMKDRMKTNLPYFSALMDTLIIRANSVKSLLNSAISSQLNVQQNVFVNLINGAAPIKTYFTDLNELTQKFSDRQTLLKTGTLHNNESSGAIKQYLETTLTRIIDLTTGLKRGCDMVYQELMDHNPIFMDIDMEFINTYKASTGHLPFMPLSNILSVLRINHNYQSQQLLPCKNGSPDFKFNRATRLILARTDLELNMAHIPGAEEIYQYYAMINDTTQSVNKTDYNALCNNLVKLARYLGMGLSYSRLFAKMVGFSNNMICVPDDKTNVLHSKYINEHAFSCIQFLDSKFKTRKAEALVGNIAAAGFTQLGDNCLDTERSSLGKNFIHDPNNELGAVPYTFVNNANTSKTSVIFGNHDNTNVIRNLTSLAYNPYFVYRHHLSSKHFLNKIKKNIRLMLILEEVLPRISYDMSGQIYKNFVVYGDIQDINNPSKNIENVFIDYTYFRLKFEGNITNLANNSPDKSVYRRYKNTLQNINNAPAFNQLYYYKIDNGYVNLQNYLEDSSSYGLFQSSYVPDGDSRFLVKEIFYSGISFTNMSVYMNEDIDNLILPHDSYNPSLNRLNLIKNANDVILAGGLPGVALPGAGVAALTNLISAWRQANIGDHLLPNYVYGIYGVNPDTGALTNIAPIGMYYYASALNYITHTLTRYEILPMLNVFSDRLTNALVTSHYYFHGFYNTSNTNAVDINCKNDPRILSVRHTLPELFEMAENRKIIQVKEQIANYMGNTPTYNNVRSSRDQLRVQNIVDMDIVPINVHAMMREIPFINILNYSYTFDRMVQDLIGYGANNDIMPLNRRVTEPRHLLIKLLQHPYAYMMEGLSERPIGFRGNFSEYYGLVSLLFNGTDTLGMGNPKFLSDQLWNKVLLNESVGQRDPFTQGHGNGDVRGLLNLGPDKMMARKRLIRYEPREGRINLTSQHTGNAYYNDSETSGLVYHDGKKWNATTQTLTRTQKMFLQELGRIRFDAKIIRNLSWLILLQRVLRVTLSTHVNYIDSVVVNGLAITNPDITEYQGNQSYDRDNASGMDMEPFYNYDADKRSIV